MTYLGCIRKETMSGESMTHEVISKVDARLKVLQRKNKCLKPNLSRLLCNALIQPHFDYTCSAWYPNLAKKLKKQKSNRQNKYICFCLQLDKISHISRKEFETIGCPLKKDVIRA